MQVLRRAGRSPVGAALFVLGALLLGGSVAARADAAPFHQEALRAADSIRRHQKPAGYWDTAVTPSTIYQSPTFEVNVFTPSLIVDLLEPIADETGVRDVVERAREYLRGQIEPTGLVRYHGAPGTAGSIPHGCELPPDSDDTALVWRIAPRDSPDLLAAARQRLQGNVDSDGFYRTWLANADEYRCFYDKFFPRHSNPPDVGIQMHVHLFLTRYDPPAAQALCSALQANISADRLWVWYAQTPLLPLLREADLARAGCSVRVPESRLLRTSTDQRPYVNAAQLLRDLSGGAATRPTSSETSKALTALAEGDFAPLRKEPPLLYHNALSAVPPHYHWSEDVGYALWLRLLVESQRQPLSSPTR